MELIPREEGVLGEYYSCVLSAVHGYAYTFATSPPWMPAPYNPRSIQINICNGRRESARTHTVQGVLKVEISYLVPGQYPKRKPKAMQRVPWKHLNILMTL